MRYPHLIPYDRCPIGMDHAHFSRMRRDVDRVVNRTGVGAWIDLRKRIVCFGYRRKADTIDLLNIAVPLFRNPRRRIPAGFDPVLDRYTVDDVVFMVNLARVDTRKKDRWRATVKSREEHDKRQEIGTYASDRNVRNEAWKRVEHEYQQHSMGRRYRKTVAMS